MQQRRLGSSLQLSALGIGCMPMTSNPVGDYGKPDEKEALATIAGAIDLGVTFFDTAEGYGPFANEELLGRAIAGRRENLVVATKFISRYDSAGDATGFDGSPANARRACEASLARLGLDCIDLFYLHRVDPQVPIEETIGGMARLVEEGKVRCLGLSECGADTLRKAHATHPIAAVQSEYSLWEREVEREILPVTRELGIGFVPFSPLGRGFLTGTISSREELAPGDYRLHDPRYSPENIAQNLVIVDAVRRVADRHGVSPARVALAWLLGRGDDIIPIPGCKRRATMEDSMAAAALILSADDISRLDAAAPMGQAAGERYEPAALRLVRL